MEYYIIAKTSKSKLILDCNSNRFEIIKEQLLTDGFKRMEVYSFDNGLSKIINYLAEDNQWIEIKRRCTII